MSKAIKFSWAIIFTFLFSLGVNNISISALEEKTLNNNEQQATINLNDLSYGVEYTIQENSIKNQKTTIMLVNSKNSIGTFSTGNDGWSGGYCPSTTTGLIVRHSETFYSASYYIDIINDCITNIYNPIVNAKFYNISQIIPSISNPIAQSGGSYARASLSWIVSEDWTGVVQSKFDYLTFEMNYYNQVRVSWSFH